MAKRAITHMHIGMMGLMLSSVFSAAMSWFVFPWWGALVISATNAISLLLLIKITFVLEGMITESDNLLKEIKRVCDEVTIQVEGTGLIN